MESLICILRRDMDPWGESISLPDASSALKPLAARHGCTITEVASPSSPETLKPQALSLCQCFNSKLSWVKVNFNEHYAVGRSLLEKVLMLARAIAS